jgi:penicillin-binding protein 1B
MVASKQSNGKGSGRRAAPPRIRRGRPRHLPKILVALLALSILTLGLIYLDVTRRFETRQAQFPSRLYSDSLRLAVNSDVPAYSLMARLSRLGYRKVAGEPGRSGEYSWAERELRISLREFEYPEGRFPGEKVRVQFRGNRIRRITGLEDGRRLEEVRIEPELIATFYSDIQEERTWYSLSDFPDALRRAVISVEDRNFFHHPGVDPRGMARALWVDLTRGAAIQGGSTITQQLAKNLYANRKRDLIRKLLESGAAVMLEARYSKNQILEAYLNEVYMGQRGPVAISGMGEAARFYFRKRPSELLVQESALLAGMISSPGSYNPYRHPQVALARRNRVLNSMTETGDLTRKEYLALKSTDLGVTRQRAGDYRAPYLVDFLEEEVRKVFPDSPPSGAGLRIFTTVDPDLQERAEESLGAGLDRLERGYPVLRKNPRGSLQGALVALRPSDGSILALVGGRDYRNSQFNRTYQARRQPGSLFKPFVYLAGFDRAQYDSNFVFTAATPLEDTPLTLVSGGKTYSPQNYDRQFRGSVTVRQALENSINVPTIRAAGRVGLENVITTARRCGVESTLPKVPSLALGTAEVTPLEIATAYATFASGGIRNPVRAIRSVCDRKGKVMEPDVIPSTRVLSPQAAYLLTDILKGVLVRGTAASAAELGFSGTGAGKTGTTDDLRDAWFAGYSPDLLALVWVGYDDNRALGLSGAQAALPIWVDFMMGSGMTTDREFSEPEGLVREKVDPATGQLATWHCPDKIEELFIQGTEPTVRCETHGHRRWWWSSEPEEPEGSASK